MINVILLAAGYSSRFGSNKLLHPVEGLPMYRHMVEAAKQFQNEYGKECIRLICVTAYEEIREALTVKDDFCLWKEALDKRLKRDFGGRFTVINRNQERGISWSLQLGMDAAYLAEEGSCLMFCVCDQPWVTAEDLRRLTEEFRRSGKTAACMKCEGETGNPVIFDRAYERELRRLSGDTGGKAVLKKHMPDICFCEAADRRTLTDIDREEDG